MQNRLGSAIVLLTLGFVACSKDPLTKLRQDASTATDAIPLLRDARVLDAVSAENDAGVIDDAAASDVEGAPDSAPTEEGVDAGTSDAVAPDATCADAGINSSTLMTTDATHTFNGTGTASTAGIATLTATGGRTLQIPFATDAAGNWSFETPLFCGTQTLDVVFTGVCAPVTEIMITRTMCSTPDIQVTLTWDDLGLDFELHLIRRGGHINDGTNDCTWTTCISQSPDWGVVGSPNDNPHKDVDNTQHYGPENIYLNGPIESPYTVMVEHWGLGLPDASGSVTILLSNGVQSTIPIVHLASHFVRNIGTIDFTTHTITTSTVVYDCTQNWSGGCVQMIP